MLLEALVACAGVTLRTVATALEIELRGGTVSAEGDLEFSRHARKPDQADRVLLRRLSNPQDAGQSPYRRQRS
jgi:hypothetical protein